MNVFRLSAACSSFLLALTAVGCASPGPAKLSVSENSRFLQTTDGEPFFWLGDTGWLMLKRLNREETEEYLEHRRQHGFNVVQAMVLHSADDTNRYGASALHDENPGRPRTTPGASLEVEDEYDFWDHIDWVVETAAQKGVYLALVPAWGSLAGNGKLTTENAAAYAEFLADRYGDASNIIWLNGGDTRGDENTDTWKLLGETLKSASPEQLMTFHPFGRRQSSEWFHNEPWLDFNMFQSGHRTYAQEADNPNAKSEDNWRFVEEDWAKSPAKPSIDGEPSYEDIPHGLHDVTQPRWKAADARRYAYWSVFAGAFGHTYGHNSVMQMYVPDTYNPAYGATKHWREAMDDPGATQMRHLKELILARPYFSRRSAQEAIVSNGERYDRVAATRGDGYLLAYTYTGAPFAVRLDGIGSDKINASWFDPRTGASTAIGEFEGRGERTFTPPSAPAPGNDWVLVLDGAD